MPKKTPNLVAILRKEGRTLVGTARLIGVSPHHLRHVAKGRYHASPRVRERLPELLGKPIEDLLPARALEKDYDPRLAGRWKKRKKVGQ